jgi:hypothetical protein
VRQWRRRVPAVCCAALLLAGCANIPEETQPQVVDENRLGQQTPEVPEPEKDLDALTLVRDFVHASAEPIGDNAAARVYLAEAARQSWEPTQSLTIIQDTFATTPAADRQRALNPNEQVVILRGFSVGRLSPDKAFIPSNESVEVPVRLRRQADGQWRIVDPPSTIVITEDDFTDNYFRVPLYFFAPDTNALVPDLRYVAAQPQSDLPGRVVDLLLSGPSNALQGAVRNPLGEQATTDGNVVTLDDGALSVPLTGVEGKTEQDKKLIAAQIVRSLQTVTSNRVRLLSDGAPLVEGRTDWRPNDIPAYEAASSPSSELPGLMVVNGRIRSLGDGTPTAGPAGQGVYEVQSAAQSVDGKRLAVVESVPSGVRLRVGGLGEPLQSVDLAARTMTRPTWKPAVSSGAAAGEFWTVVDGEQVVRVVRTPDGTWVPQSVNATDLLAIGPITALRLSRDGTRVAAVVGGQLAVAAVVREPDSVTLRSSRVLQARDLTGVVDVDWASQDTLVAAVSSESVPVVRLPVDGLRMDVFNSSNLTSPVRSITAAPGRSVLVADAGGLWTAADVGEVWRPHPHSPNQQADPFYPG